MSKKNWLTVLILLVSFGIMIGLTGCNQNGTSQETENLKKEIEDLKKQNEEKKLTKEKEELAKQKADLETEKQKLESDKKKSEITKEKAKVKKGMLYANARKIFMSEGWKPVNSNSQNNDPDEDEAGNAQTRSVSKKFPEVMECAPTGLAPCTFEFSGSNNKTLYVYTTGESGQTVTSWEIQ
jgi:cell division protein FtsB